MRRPNLFLLLLVVVHAAPAAAQFRVSAGAADFTFGGRLHLQYSASSMDGEDGEPDAIDDVFVRRARLQVNLRMGDLFDARVEPDFVSTGGATIGLADAWARVTLDDAFRISAGQFKRAFSTFELTSSTDVAVIERDGRIEGVANCPGVASVCSFSRLAERLQFDDRDVGVRVEGEIGDHVSYLTTLTNGEGRNAADVNDGKSFSGRVVVEPVEDLLIAGFAGSHDYLDDEEDERAAAFGADLEWGPFRDGFRLVAGVATGDNWLAGPQADFTTVQGLASYYFGFDRRASVAGVEPLIRVSWATTEDGAGIDREALLLTPGIALYLVGKNFVAVNLDQYDPDFDGKEWSLKVQAFAFF